MGIEAIWGTTLSFFTALDVAAAARGRVAIWVNVPSFDNHTTLSDKWNTR